MTIGPYKTDEEYALALFMELGAELGIQITPIIKKPRTDLAVYFIGNQIVIHEK